MRGLAPILAATLALFGCAGAWDVSALEASQPGLAALPGQRLGDATPYLLPAEDTLILFLCRWPDDQPIRVVPPADATPRERALFERALDAWRDALPGVVLVSVEAGSEGEIESSFDRLHRTRAGETGAECALDPGAALDGPQLRARLVYARVSMQRSAQDVRGRDVPFSDAEILGAAIHELGHALGFQGHAKRGSVMVREVSEVRAIGRRVLAGASLDEPTLAALYAVPTGVVVGRDALPPGRTRAFDALAKSARSGGWDGPWIRLGDRAERILWSEAGTERRLWIPDPHRVVEDPQRLRIEAE